jgi:hypothetical protein
MHKALITIRLKIKNKLKTRSTNDIDKATANMLKYKRVLILIYKGGGET